MKILILDIETSPNIAHVWSTYKTFVSPEQLVTSHDVLCFAAKWYGSGEVIYASRYHDGYGPMLARICELLDQADVVVHFNGKNDAGSADQ